MDGVLVETNTLSICQIIFFSTLFEETEILLLQLFPHVL